MWLAFQGLSQPKAFLPNLECYGIIFPSFFLKEQLLRILGATACEDRRFVPFTRVRSRMNPNLNS